MYLPKLRLHGKSRVDRLLEGEHVGGRRVLAGGRGLYQRGDQQGRDHRVTCLAASCREPRPVRECAAPRAAPSASFLPTARPRTQDPASALRPTPTPREGAFHRRFRRALSANRPVGHHSKTGHSWCAGLRARQGPRPRNTSWCGSSAHLRLGTSSINSRSMWSGSSCPVRARRWLVRRTCVSTKMPWSDWGRGQQLARTTFAVLRATPGSWTRSSIRRGTSPWKRATRAWAQPMIAFVFWRKKPVGWMSASTFSGEAVLRAAASG